MIINVLLIFLMTDTASTTPFGTFGYPGSWWGRRMTSAGGGEEDWRRE
jgi:hypothetical protein